MKPHILKYLLFAILFELLINQTLYIYSSVYIPPVNVSYKQNIQKKVIKTQMVSSDIIMASVDESGNIRSVIFSGEEMVILVELAKKWNDNTKFNNFLSIAHEKPKDKFMKIAIFELKNNTEILAQKKTNQFKE